MSWRNEWDPEYDQRRKQARLMDKLRRLQRDAFKLGVDITPILVECVRAAEKVIVSKRGD